MSIATGACAAVGLALWVSSPMARGRRTPVDLPAMAWIAALMLAAYFAVDRAASLPRLTKGLFPVLVPLVAFLARDASAGRRAVATLLISSALASVFGLAWFVAQGGGLEARARGAVGHYMTYGGQLLLIASAAGGLAFGARDPRWRALGIGAAALALLALAATYTRGAWIGLGVATVVLLVLLRPRLLPAMVALAVAGLLLAPAPIRERVFSIADRRDPTSLERTYMWRAGLAMFRDRPLTGVGLQDLKPLYERYRPAAAKEPAGHLHSVPVQIAATMGIAGLAAFVWLVAGMFRAVRPGHAGERRAGGLGQGLRAGVTAGLAGFLAAGLFEWNFGDEELLYLLFALVGLAWAARGWDPPAATTRAFDAGSLGP